MLQIILGLFIFGGIAGAVGDFCHVVTRTDGYLNPWMPIPFTEQPGWVPFLFGAATLSIGLSHSLGDRVFKIQKIRENGFAAILAANMAFLLLYAASGFLPLATGGLKDAVMFLGALAIWAYFDRSPWGLCLGLMTAATGVVVEVLLTRSGAFYYYPEVANFFGVPSWLGWLYVAASVSVGHAMRYFLRK